MEACSYARQSSRRSVKRDLTGRVKGIKSMWNGPRWLTEHQHWQLPTHTSVDKKTSPEIRELKLVLTTVNSDNRLVNAYSDWNQLIRANARMAKFIEYLRAKRATLTIRILMVQDLQVSKTGLLRKAPEDTYMKEITCLSKETDVSHKSKLKSLCPYLKDGLIRVGEKL